MRVAICFLAMMVGYVMCETCSNTDTTACIATTCGIGYTLTCHNSECVCIGAAGGSCIAQADCHSHHCHNDHDVAHCVDGSCHCRNHGGGGGGNQGGPPGGK